MCNLGRKGDSTIKSRYFFYRRPKFSSQHWGQMTLISALRDLTLPSGLYRHMIHKHTHLKIKLHLHCLTFIREVSSCRWDLAQRSTTGQCAVRDHEALSSKNGGWGSGINAKKGGRKILKLEVISGSWQSSRQNRAGAHRIQRLTSCTFKPDKIPAERRGSRHGLPALTTKLFAVVTCWERENHFSPM